MKLPWYYIQDGEPELKDDGMCINYKFHWLWKLWKWVQFRFQYKRQPVKQ